MGFLGWLTLAFVVLKLVGYFPYSWLWVFAPLAIGVVLGLGLLVLAVVIKWWAEK